MKHQTKSESLSPFELDQLEKDARRRIVCPSCGGVGQVHQRKNRQDDGRWELCNRCEGDGRATAEPDVLRLIDEVRAWRAQEVQ